MRRNLLIALVLAAAGAVPGFAQTFKGSGPEATRTFSLGEGLAVFEVQHKGSGYFLVKLLDADGNVVDEVARGEGRFGGSKAVRIPRTGLYLFDVSASGDWDVRLRSNEMAPAEITDSPLAARGREEGEAAAGQTGTLGWVARGFVGGALLGPIGTGLAVNFAGNSADAAGVEAAGQLPLQELAYSTAWRQAYIERLRGRRQRATLIGGAVGTGVLVFAIIKAVDLGRSAEGEETGGDPTPFLVIPIRW